MIEPMSAVNIMVVICSFKKIPYRIPLKLQEVHVFP